jgi:hypothetical protein
MAAPLESVKLRNVRCFRSTEVPLSPDITVIIGGNGSGKTTVLEALASLASGETEGLREFPLRRGAKSGEIALVSGRSAAAKWSHGPTKQGRRRLSADTFVLVYGRYRRVYTERVEEEEYQRYTDPLVLLDQLASRAHLDCTTTLTVAENNLARDVSDYVAALDAGRRIDPRFELMWDRLNASLPKMDPALEGLRMEERANRMVPVILRRGLPLEFRELSDGYQALLVILFDLMLRYPYLFPELENPLDGTATVGIDEVDLHLHPRWQRTVVLQLAELFPRTQFVLTTHSPLVVQGAIDHKREILRMVETDGEVHPEPLSPSLLRELQGAEVGSVLFEDRLFDLPSRYSTVYSEVEQQIEETGKRIRRGTATDADYTAATRQAATMEKLVAKEDSRRADGSSVGQISRLQKALVDDLVRELRALKK